MSLTPEVVEIVGLVACTLKNILFFGTEEMLDHLASFRQVERRFHTPSKIKWLIVDLLWFIKSLQSSPKFPQPLPHKKRKKSQWTFFFLNAR